jgi:hypothetical protein
MTGPWTPYDKELDEATLTPAGRKTYLIMRTGYLRCLQDNGLADYPTDEELQALEDYRGPAEGMLDLLRPIWHWGIRDEWVTRNGSRLYLATGGWSGNEDIIDALQHNWAWWAINWHKSMGGGAFWFRFDSQDREEM